MTKDMEAFLARMRAAEPKHSRAAAGLGRTLLKEAARVERITQGDLQREETYKGAERRIELANVRIQMKVRELNKLCGYTHENGWQVDVGGDPRGYPVSVHFPNRDTYNTMGGREAGFGVPLPRSLEN